MGQTSNGALNFDSPSTAAAMRALDIGGGFDLGLDNVGAGALGGFGNAFSSEDDKVKRLDQILEILNVRILMSPTFSRLTACRRRRDTSVKTAWLAWPND